MASATQEPTKTESSSTAAELKQKLKQHLDHAREQFEGVRKEIDELREEDKENIKQKAAEIRKRIDSQQQKAQEMRTQASNWLREKKEQTEEAITSWRQKREMKRLQSRAERAEEYAVNAVAVAMMDVETAEMAMLDALEARLDAEAAATGK